MISRTPSRSVCTITSLLLFLLLAFATARATERTDDLAGKVAALRLGMNGYTIGTRLPAERKEYSSAHLLGDAYEGTYKFSDGELAVVAALEDDTVLAVYQRNEQAGIKQAKKMISGLMGLFGEPTAMAHDKLIYWAYDEEGKIPEGKYEESKNGPAQLQVLATVKFSSSIPIMEENPDGEPQGTVYFIISSDRLTGQFMNKE